MLFLREKALNIALNKITGAWDEDMLSDLLKDLQEDGFDLSFTGFDPPEIESLFNTVEKEAHEDDFDVESELKQPAFSMPGDVWHLGKHTVICGGSGGLRLAEPVMAGGASTTTTNNNQRTINMGGIHLTVNGYNVQDDDQLATMVANKINDMMDEDNSVFK